MTDAITLMICTKDNLIITATLKIHEGNQFSDFNISPLFPSAERDENAPKHAFDINNPNDPGFIKVDDITSQMLMRDVRHLQSELMKMGIELAESAKNPKLCE